MCLSIYAGSKKDWLIIEKTEGYFFFLSFFLFSEAITDVLGKDSQIRQSARPFVIKKIYIFDNNRFGGCSNK